jgi:hypothetical protein
MVHAFVELDTETFGESLRRARNRRGVALMDAAAHLTAVFQPMSFHALRRLELINETPSDPKRLIVAAVYLASLGYDPSAPPFDIDLSALPAIYHSPEELVARFLMPSSAWGTADDGGVGRAFTAASAPLADVA